MERCPNCGATVRLGAKFCTTCGMRLPELAPTEPAASSSSPIRSPFESTSSVAAHRWPAERSSQEPIGDAASGYAVEASSGGRPGEAVGQAKESLSVESEPTEVASSSTSDDAEAAPTSVWPPLGRTSTWDSSWQSAAAQSEPEEPPAGTEVSGAPAPETETETAPEVEAEIIGTETGSPTDVDPGPVETEALNEAQVVETVATDDSPQEPATETVVDAVEEIAVDADAGTATEYATAAIAPESPAVPGVLERAHALLDELKALLPNLSSVDSEQADGDAIANDLAAAQSLPGDRESFAELRSAIDSARDRPRDIDTMLDVSGRLDAIASLHDAYERLSSAVDGVVKHMRPSGADESGADDSDRPPST